MELLRDWSVPYPYASSLHCQDNPQDERSCGSSLKWMCTKCGANYARMIALKDLVEQTWSFIHGLCPSCPGNRYSLPGSLECLTLAGWPEVPLPILLYQLECELRFLDHPHHPHNMEYD